MIRRTETDISAGETVSIEQKAYRNASGELLIIDATEPVHDGFQETQDYAPRVVISAEAIAASRYQAEVGGITLNGLQINTDDRSKLLINGAALEATIDPEYAMQWETAAGFVELTGAQVIGIARAVRAHVQACFDREAELLAELEAGTLTGEMLEQGWPV